MNAVIGSDAREETDRIRTLRNGIDFIYDGVKVEIVVRYSHYLFQANVTTGLPEDFPPHFQSLFRRPVSEVVDWLTIHIGSLFEHSHAVYSVKAVIQVGANSHLVEATCLYPLAEKGTVVQFDDYASIIEAINLYNDL